jgi:hypothetical protein
MAFPVKSPIKLPIPKKSKLIKLTYDGMIMVRGGTIIEKSKSEKSSPLKRNLKRANPYPARLHDISCKTVQTIVISPVVNAILRKFSFSITF